MRKWLGFVFVGSLALALAAALGRVPEALARADAFRVKGVRLSGAHFLTEEEAWKALALDPGASVWDDVHRWEERIRAHPLVESVRVHRRFPSTLLLEVEEREPIALLPTPTLEPVDEAGRVLPVDPARFRLDLPILMAGPGKSESPLTPSERRLLAGEVARIGQLEPTLASRISEACLLPREEIELRLLDPPVSLLLRPGLSGSRLEEGLMVLNDALARFGPEGVRQIDLRYADQVVVRTSRARGG